MPDPPVPTDAELRERVEQALKNTVLFHRVSRRLLADLIEVVGVRHIDGPAPINTNTMPAVLVVLEGELYVYVGATRFVLRPGTYLALDPIMIGIDWPNAKIEPPPDQPIRVFLLDKQFFLGRMPPVIINTLDTAALDDMHTHL